MASSTETESGDLPEDFACTADIENQDDLVNRAAEQFARLFLQQVLDRKRRR